MDLYQFECLEPRESPQVVIPQEIQQPVRIQAPRSYAAAVSHSERPSYDFNSLPIPEQMGEYPAVTISSTALERGINYCKFCLLGRMDVKKVGIDRIRKIVVDTWKPSGDWVVTPLGKGFIFIRFDNANDYNRVWSAGSTWVFDNEPLRISKWVPNFVPENQKQTRAMAWIRLPGLAQEYWDEEILMSIAMGMGNPMQVDERTLKREYGYFAQILVDIDFAQPIPSQIMVRAPKIKDRPAVDFWQTVEIPKYPKICSHCKIVGHLIQDCTVLHGDNAPRGGQQHEAAPRGQQSDVVRNQLQQNLAPAPITNFHVGEPSNINEQQNNGWQMRNRRSRQNWAPRTQGIQNNRPRVGVHTNGNRYQVLKRTEVETRAEIVTDRASIPAENPEFARPPEGIDTTTQSGNVVDISVIQPIVNEREDARVLKVTSPIQGAVASDIPSPVLDQNAKGIDSSDLDPGDNSPENPEVIPETQETQVLNQDENAEEHEAQVENEEENSAKKDQDKLLKEIDVVSNMIHEQNQSWADLLDDEEDDSRVSRPSLSQPRRSGRSRSRNRLLDPYVSK